MMPSLSLLKTGHWALQLASTSLMTGCSKQPWKSAVDLWLPTSLGFAWMPIHLAVLWRIVPGAQASFRRHRGKLCPWKKARRELIKKAALIFTTDLYLCALIFMI